MKKLIKFLKLPLLLISSAVFVASLAVLLIVSVSPHGKVYKTDDMEDYGQYISIVFNDGDTMTVKTETWGVKADVKYDYEIEDGKLYLKPETAENFEYAGKINAYELLLKYDFGGSTAIQLECECVMNEILKDVSIALVAVSVVLLAASIVVIVLDKKGKLNKFKKESVEEKAEVKAEENA